MLITKYIDTYYRDVFDMTFHTESRKVHDVTMGMTLTSRLLKKGGAMYVTVIYKKHVFIRLQCLFVYKQVIILH